MAPFSTWEQKNYGQSQPYSKPQDLLTGLTMTKPENPPPVPLHYRKSYDDSDDDSDSDDNSSDGRDTIIANEDGQMHPTIKCSYDGCDELFFTVKDMKAHKVDEPLHEYCRKCDVDFENWDELVQHKVDAMAPWLEHRMGSGTSPAHIVCELCGMDFKSFGGRRIHRESEHRTTHEVNCPGCRVVFMRVAELVAHLEEGNCPTIPADEFMARIQQKRAVAQIMKAPQIFLENLAMNQNSIMFQLPISQSKLARLTDGAETWDKEDGGVSLMDMEYPDQKKGPKPLTPEEDLIQLNLPLTRQNLESWPRLPGQQPSQLKDSLRAPSVMSDDCGSDVTSRRGGLKIVTEDMQSRRSTLTSPSVCDRHDPFIADDSSNNRFAAARSSTGTNQRAWGGVKTTKKLFKGAKPTPLTPADAGAIVKHQEAALEAHRNAAGDLFTARFWNPLSADYNAKLFYRFDNVTQSGKYCCPFPNCVGSQWDVPEDIEAHLRVAHLNTGFHCSQCLKRFKSAAGLMAHIEDTRKCAITESDGFKQLVGEITGDYIKADNIIQPKILGRNNDTSLVKAGQTATGVTNVKFKSQMPRW